jgi:uncharacterized surface protein with fasciclin (FAS1) repeats
VKNRGNAKFGVGAALTAIALSIPVAVSAHGDPPAEPTPSTATTSSTTSTSTTTSTQTETGAAAPDPEGPACGAYKDKNPSGKGSFAAMPSESVTQALANNPMLTTFSKAISGQLNPQVNLVDNLNIGYHVVFAPTDDAFASLPPERLSALQADPAALTNLLNYHVVLGLLGPAEVHGRLTTLQGKQVTVKGSGGDIKVDDVAKVTCGGIHTTNSVIYMIDTVLDPAGAIETSTTTTSPTETSSSTQTSSSSATTTTQPAQR